MATTDRTDFELSRFEVHDDPETTGRLLVVTDIHQSQAGTTTTRSLKQASKDVRGTLGVEVAHSSDFDGGLTCTVIDETLSADVAVMLDDLGIVIVADQDDAEPRLADACADTNSTIGSVEPEHVMWALDNLRADDGHDIATYVSGYRDGVDAMAQALLRRDATPPRRFGPAPAARFEDTDALTWGLQVVGASGSVDVGVDARVAVLDTGIDTSHPDLMHALDTVRMQSFITGEDVEDGHGHGTHCCGTVAGRLTPDGAPRYGVAPGTELWVGKVLSDAGSGADAGILAGIQWAIQNGCHVISMSLGSPSESHGSYSQAYERAAVVALSRGSLILAAAGNDSRRPTTIAPVARPANCPSVLAVAALDQDLGVASFSNGEADGVGRVALAAPGVQVLSAAAGGGHTTMSGTSMATPHAAGVAAVIQARDDLAGAELGLRLMSLTRGLGAPSTDTGAGHAFVNI